jgi:N6-L-threonylcarbamoyladenine synthase
VLQTPKNYNFAAMRVLGIETSCDETAAAVVDDGPKLVTSIVHTQVATHARFGGVVPEVASREHVARIVDIIDQAVEPVGGIDTIDAVAVTRGPGLVGALLVGVQMAKGIALARGIPWLGINHLEGHVAAALLADAPPTYPHVALVVSGGHTHLYAVHDFGQYALLGGTRDDAAGEAFDKVAKLLGLGYPGGAAIEREGRSGDPAAIKFPRALPQRASLEFSFSGLKTAVATYLRERPALEGQERADLCASVQEAIVDVLSAKAVNAARKIGAKGVVVAGGVAANTRLRELLSERCNAKGLWAFIPPKSLCTDNAAMIAAAGWMRLTKGEHDAFDTSVTSRWPLGNAIDTRVRIKNRKVKAS